jgi:hypothetical protein
VLKPLFRIDQFCHAIPSARATVGTMASVRPGHSSTSSTALGTDAPFKGVKTFRALIAQPHQPFRLPRPA